MHILLIRNAYEYDFGGGERFPVHLAAELNALGYETTVVSSQKRLLTYAQSQGVSARRGLWWSKQNWSGLSLLFLPVYCAWQSVLFWWYMQLFIRLRPDVVHPQSKDDFIAATLAGRLLGKRVVWTDHADLKHVFANHPVWYKNPVGKLVYACSRLAHAVTLVSHSEADLIEKSLGQALPANFTVIHNGVKPTSVKKIIRDETDVDSVIFCATSRLVAAKGINELLAAFMAYDNPHARLWLVGDGPDEALFRKQGEPDSRIAFFGHQDNPLPYLAAADVYVHPTHHEGFSIGLVEAAMLGKPLLVTNVGGNPEIVDVSNGILVPSQDIPALKDALEKLGSDPALRSRLGIHAQKRFEKDFNFETIVRERFIPLYENHRAH